MNPFKKIIAMYKEAYRGLPREAWLLAFVDFINRSGTMVFFFMTLYLTQVFHYPAAKAGQVLSGYGLGALLGAYLGGKLTDALGAYNVQKASLILEGASLILLGQVTSFPAVLVMMFCTGVAAEAMHPAITSAMSQVCPPEIRTKGFALRRLSSNLGVTIGPVVGGYLAMINYSLIFWIDGLTCLLAAGVFMIFFKTARPVFLSTETPVSKTISVWKDFYFLKVLAFTFLIGVIFTQIFNTMPLYYKTVYGFKENHIGLFLAINTIIIVLFEMLLLHALKNKSITKIVATGSFLLGTGLALMPMGKGALFVGFTVVVWTMGEILTLPPLTTLVAEHSSDAVRGKYLGLFSFAISLGLTVGPALGTKIYASLGPTILWLGCGITGLLLCFGFLSIKKK
jgi:predicted MFS family arabinose efflux permease